MEASSLTPGGERSRTVRFAGGGIRGGGGSGAVAVGAVEWFLGGGDVDVQLDAACDVLAGQGDQDA